jgi:hypothetical protein
MFMRIMMFIKWFLVYGFVVYLFVFPFVAYTIMFYSDMHLNHEILSRNLPEHLSDAVNRLDIVIFLQGTGLHLACLYIVLCLRKKRSSASITLPVVS